MDIYMGSIMSFAFPFAPANWAMCDGELLSISQYEALFVILGTVYGGDGVNTFGRPNLMGRMPMGQGQGSGLSNQIIGQPKGNERVTLLPTNIPAHNHVATPHIQVNTSIMLANPGTGQLPAPSATNGWIGAAADGSANIFASEAGNAAALQEGITNTLSADVTLSVAGSGLPLEIGNPSLVLNFSIALLGIFPTRN